MSNSAMNWEKVAKQLQKVAREHRYYGAGIMTVTIVILQGEVFALAAPDVKVLQPRDKGLAIAQMLSGQLVGNDTEVDEKP